MPSPAFTPSSFIASFEVIPQTYLQAVYPAIAGLVSTPVYFCCVIYFVMWGYSVYDGRSSFSLKEGMLKVLTISLVLGSLSWGGFAGQAYNMVLEVMNSAAGTIIAGRQYSSTLDGISEQFNKISSQMMKQDITSIGIILLGLLIYGITEAFLVLATVYMVISKMMIAITFSLLPIFIAFLIWPETRQWFINWVSKVLNGVFMYILTFAILKFGFQFADTYFDQAAGLAAMDVAALTFNQIAFVFPTFGVLIILLLQVKSWSAALAGGAAVQGMSALAFATSMFKKGIK